MKRLTDIFLLLCLVLAAVSCKDSGEERSHVLKVYNWADYIDEDVLAEFPAWYKQQTGEDIRLIYQVFDINEIMLTKIERGHEDFDVVCPSEYIIERMLKKDLLLPIDRNFGKTPDYLPNISPYIRRELNILLVTAICFLIYLSARTVIWLRRLFSLSFLKRKEKAESVLGETPEEFKTSWGAKEKTTAPTPEAAEPEKVLEKEEEVATEEEEDEPLNEITLDLGGSDGKVKPAKSADDQAGGRPQHRR